MVLNELIFSLKTTPEIRVINAESGKTIFVGYSHVDKYKNHKIVYISPRIYQNRYSIKPIIDIAITPYEVEDGKT